MANENSLDNILDIHKNKIAGFLEGRVPNLPTDELARESPIPNRVEREYVNSFKTASRALWAYSFFLLKVNISFKILLQTQTLGKVNLDLWTKCVFELNKMIKKIHSFLGLTKLMKKELELLYQINNFSTIYGKNSLQLDINLLQSSKIHFASPKYPPKQYIINNYFHSKGAFSCLSLI